jgi:hypothetical protein
MFNKKLSKIKFVIHLTARVAKKKRKERNENAKSLG